MQAAEGIRYFKEKSLVFVFRGINNFSNLFGVYINFMFIDALICYFFSLCALS